MRTRTLKLACHLPCQQKKEEGTEGSPQIPNGMQTSQILCLPDLDPSWPPPRIYLAPTGSAGSLLAGMHRWHSLVNRWTTQTTTTTTADIW